MGPLLAMVDLLSPVLPDLLSDPRPIRAGSWLTGAMGMVMLAHKNIQSIVCRLGHAFPQRVRQSIRPR
jgi:hypothetical protein